MSEIKGTAAETTAALEQISGDVGNKRTALDTTVRYNACLYMCVCVFAFCIECSLLRVVFAQIA